MKVCMIEEGRVAMKCPDCSKEMARGFIRSPQRIFWSKEEERSLLVDDEKIKLSQNFWDGFFRGFLVESFYCPDCKKIITSVE